MNFSEFGVDARLMRAIEHAGYESATPIQAKAIPVALEGKDIIGTAQTGTGKTAAFVLPILQRLLQRAERPPHRALIVTPTRELAEQINDTVRMLSKGTHIRTRNHLWRRGFCATGARPERRRGDPGGLPGPAARSHWHRAAASWIASKCWCWTKPTACSTWAFCRRCAASSDHVPKKRQTMLFSATFPREVEALAADELHQPVRADVGKSKAAHTVAHALYPVPNHLKADLLVALLKHTDAYSMLVFTRTKHRAERLARVLGKQGFMTTSLHSDRSQNQRQSALRRLQGRQVSGHGGDGHRRARPGHRERVACDQLRHA